MKPGGSFEFKGNSGKKYPFTIYPKKHTPASVAGIFIYAKKLAFSKNDAVFLIPVMIKKSNNMTEDVRLLQNSDFPELNEVDHFCIYQEADTKKQDEIYHDLIARYDEGDMLERSGQY